MIHELRKYEATAGRLEDLNRRFREIALPVWARLGIRPIAFWTTLIGPSNNALYYVLGWESLAEREQLWARFLADEEWVRRKAETERDGILVARAENLILQLTDYSPRVG